MELKQGILDQYWTGVKNVQSRPSFLQLPSTLRRQIYIEAGFPFEQYIPLPTDRTEHIDSQTGYIALSLLLVCRQVHGEVQQMLLACNVFTACLKHPGDSYHLLRFRERISAMRHLLIYVKPEEKLNQSLLCYGKAASSLFEHLPTCSTHSRQRMKTAFLEFREILSFILANTTPNTLELGLILYTGDDNELAKWLLLPLASAQARPLADCAIFLGKRYDLDRSEIARKFATQIVNKRNTLTSIPFRFEDLPPELRRLILSFTDLVFPGGEIECLPAGIYSSHVNKSYESACEYGGELNFGRFPDGSCLHHDFSCAWVGSGYSQYCRCWSPPTAIMLCSRWLYREAMSVFFDMNQFRVTPEYDVFARRLDPRARVKEIVP